MHWGEQVKAVAKHSLLPGYWWGRAASCKVADGQVRPLEQVRSHRWKGVKEGREGWIGGVGKKGQWWGEDGQIRPRRRWVANDESWLFSWFWSTFQNQCGLVSVIKLVQVQGDPQWLLGLSWECQEDVQERSVREGSWRKWEVAKVA